MPTIPSGISYVHLPLGDMTGSSISDSGNSGATFTVVDGSATAWSANDSFFSGSNASGNCLYSHDSGFQDILDMFGQNGVGGKCVFMSFEWIGAVASGTLLTFGSTTGSSGGFQILHSGSQLSININPTGAATGSSRKFCGTSDWPNSGTHHACFMMDFKNGNFAVVIDGEASFLPTADMANVFADADKVVPGDGTMGGVLLSRNTATTNSAPSLQSSSDMAIRKFFLWNLTSVINPWRAWYRDAEAFRNAGIGTVPKVVEQWLT